MPKYSKDELEILDAVEKGEFQSIENMEEELSTLKVAAKNTTSKTKNINIRVSEADIAKIKTKSIEVGIPYQTLISSLIHSYANGKVKLGI